ncbi:MAG: hypothetical protein NTU95_11630 [Methanothrix sp.]|nr:hypothetical protein [Methanothrix sp.]
MKKKKIIYTLDSKLNDIIQAGPEMKKKVTDLKRSILDVPLIRASCPFMMLSLALIFANMAMAATNAPYVFSSKVNFNDFDAGNPLYNICFNLGFRDIGKERNIYDEKDPVYLDMAVNAEDENIYVGINDIRLTPFANFLPGSKVRRIDADINAPLLYLINWSFVCSELDGNEIYDLRDPLYLHNRTLGNEIVPGDIRLTSFRDFIAGTKVMNSDWDAGISVFDLDGLPTNDMNHIAAIRFYNANGNYLEGKPVYDSPDAVYLDISFFDRYTMDLSFIPDVNESYIESMGMVDANDLRLSI